MDCTSSVFGRPNASTIFFMASDNENELLIQTHKWLLLFDTKILSLCILYSVLLGIIVYFKLVCFARINFTLCLLCWLAKLPLDDVGTNEDTVCSNTDASPSLSSLLIFWTTLRRSRILGYMLYVTLTVSVFSAFWKTKKLNIVKDMTDVGFEHLEATAKTRGKTPREYVSETLARRDPGKIPPVFPNGWIPIVESSDVPMGKPISVSALGRQFAVFRGLNGKVCVLDAFCPHLGANLAVGGKIEGNCLKCPFHGWKFDGESGKCVFIPYTSKVPEVAKTNSWTCREVNGFVYLWHHAEGIEPFWEIPQIEEIASKKWPFKGRTEHIVRCHIQEIPENGADVAHLHELHSPSMFSGKPFSKLLFDWTFMKHDWHPNWEPCKEEGQTHTAKVSLSQHVTLFDVKVPLTSFVVDIRQIGPALVHLHFQTSFGRAVLIQNITPEGPLQQRIVHLLYAEPCFHQIIANILLRGEAIMLERDIMIWNNKKFISNPILVREDRLISRYRRWYSQFYSPGSPTLRDVQERSLDW